VHGKQTKASRNLTH